MSKNIHDIEQARSAKATAVQQKRLDHLLSLPPTLTREQCLQAREVLGWSVQALAFRSGASVQAITQYEAGQRELRDITRQALAFAFEGEGLLLIPGFKPSKSENLRGVTVDPRQRSDFHLIE